MCSTNSEAQDSTCKWWLWMWSLRLMTARASGGNACGASGSWQHVQVVDINVDCGVSGPWQQPLMAMTQNGWTNWQRLRHLFLCQSMFSTRFFSSFYTFFVSPTIYLCLSLFQFVSSGKDRSYCFVSFFISSPFRFCFPSFASLFLGHFLSLSKMLHCSMIVSQSV